MHLSRRGVLAGLGAGWMFGGAQLAFAAAATDRRLVVILLRGALDGLAAVPPYGEARLAALRGPLVPPPPGTPGGMFDLGGFFGLHPALPGLASLYRAGELLVVHATAGANRSRSHFDAQDALECGTEHRIDSGWLNRVVAELPHAAAPGQEAFAVGVGLPLLLRGAAPAESWLPENAVVPPPELFARIAALNASDPNLGPALRDGMRSRGFAEGVLGTPAGGPAAPPGGSGGAIALAAQSGRLLAAAEGPRVAALELGGWDTHAGQAPRLAAALRELDRTVMALRGGLGEAWSRSTLLILTEFGRTVRINGTAGTDHGTATVTFVAGGGVAGGRVAGPWPGLGSLYENRDLSPTTDVRAVAAGVLAGQYGLSKATLARVFPGFNAHPMGQLMRL